MRIAVTGGTGFVGGALAHRVRAAGHDVVVVGRSAGIDITDVEAMTGALRGCDAVAHCAGINRELGDQTYQRVHVMGTAAVVRAATDAGVRRLVSVSFLRARADGPSAYHRSKWQAEETVRASDLDWTVLKPGIVHGRGDHMLDHLSHVFHTLPVFGTVGVRGRERRLVRPIAVDDLARVLEAAVLGDVRLSRRTVSVMGPETLTLDAAVRRVAAAVGKRPLFVPLPMPALLAFAWLTERTMHVPLLALAQARILEEGLVEPAPYAESPPADLAPTTPFSIEVIQAGLPDPVPFGLGDMRCRSRFRQIPGRTDR